MKTRFYLMAAIAAFSLVVMNSCSNPELIIEAEVQAANIRCPQDMGNGLTLTRVENDARYIIYYYKGDDMIYSFSQDLVTDAQKEQIINTLQTQANSIPDVKKFIKALKEADKGITYHYFTSSSSMDIIVKPNELRY